MRSRIGTGRPPLSIITSIAAGLLAVGIGVFFVPAGAGGGPEVLARVDVSAPEAWRLLHSLDAQLHFRGADYAVVRLERESTSALDVNGIAWSELPHDPRASLFYIMYEGDAEHALPLNVTVLARDNDGVLVSAEKPAALSARREGHKILPLDRSRPVWRMDFVDLDFVHDDAVALEKYLQITRRVNPDSIGGFIQHLEDYGTRYAYTPEIIQAGQWLLRRLWGFGYPDTLLQSVQLEGKVSLAPGNVVATKFGSTVPEYRILVGGHYDSIVSGGGAAGRAPGADDNASGTAGTLEIARLLSGVDLDATVEFVLFTAEEIGLLGSLEYVTQLEATGVPREKTFFINMDMIGNSGEHWKTRIYHNVTSEPLAELLANVGEVYSKTAPHLMGPMSQSDHINFWQFGYPAVFIHEMDFSRDVYHTTNDLLEFLEMDYEAEVIKMVLGTILHLANIADPPRDVAAHQSESGEVLVEWTHSSDADLLGYNVEVVDDRGDLIHETYTRDNFALLDASGFGGSSRVRVRPEDVLGFGETSAEIIIGSGRGLVAGATPNPTTEGCRFDIFVPGSGGQVDAVIKVVDALGRQIAEIHNGPLDRGSSSFQWRGTTPEGDRVPAGVYFFVIETAGGGETGGKLMVVR